MTEFVYLMSSPELVAGRVKIGRTTSPQRRLTNMRTALPSARYDLLIETPDAEALEEHLHDLFRDRRAEGEWFSGVEVHEAREAAVAFQPGAAEFVDERLPDRSPVKRKEHAMPASGVDVYADDGRAFPWAPQPDETALAYASFCVYRDLGPKRTVAQAGRECGRDASTLRDLSARHSWVERAFAYDTWLDNRAVEELAHGRIAMRKAHVGIAEMAREKILARLEMMKPEEMSVRDLAVWLDLSVKIERQARGEADKTVRVEGSIDVNELGTDQRRALMAEALQVLNERLGVADAAREVEGYMEGEVIEDGE